MQPFERLLEWKGTLPFLIGPTLKPTKLTGTKSGPSCSDFGGGVAEALAGLGRPKRLREASRMGIPRPALINDVTNNKWEPLLAYPPVYEELVAPI